MRKLFILGLLLLILEATTVTARAQLVHTPPFTEYRLDTLARTYIHFPHDVGYAETSESPETQDKAPLFSARTNLLVPLLNAGVEVPLGNNWSVAADYYYPWIWPNQKNKNCFELLGWSMEGRYWFGRDRQSQDRLKGHSVGVYMAGGYYDFEKNYRGMQGEFLSPGLDYTYSMAVGKAKRVHLQFTLAVGYIRSWGRTYNVYGDYGALYPDDGTVIWDYFGPTKAAVSIVVPFYRKEDRR